jgi:hypothetical protein
MLTTLQFGPFQFLDESSKLLQLSETLDRCELEIFANQRGVEAESELQEPMIEFENMLGGNAPVELSRLS